MSYDPDFYNQVEGFENIVLSEEEEADLDRAWEKLSAEWAAEEEKNAETIHAPLGGGCRTGLSS